MKSRGWIAMIGVILASCTPSSPKRATDGGPVHNPTSGASAPPAVIAPDGTVPIPSTPIPKNSQTPIPVTSSTPIQATSCYKGDATICEIETKIVEQTNLIRGSTRKPLTQLKELSFVARSWSTTQGKRGSIGHDGFPDQREALFKTEFGALTLFIAAENVAMSGGSSSTSASAIAKMFTDMWNQSPGHRANMLGNYSVIGVGIFRNGNYWYGTQIFGNL